MRWIAVFVLVTLGATACGRLADSSAPGETQRNVETPIAASGDADASGAASNESANAPDAEPTEAAPEPTATPVPAQTVSDDRCGGSLEGCFTYNEMDEYLNLILPMVAQYFQTEYEDVPAPRDVVYIPNDRVARTYCGVSTSQAYEYCTGNQTIYIGQDLLWAFYKEAGDAAPAVALAHEFGHHLQYMLGVPNARTRSDAITFENQADCISGAWAAYADEQGWLETEDDIGDVDTLLQLIGARESRARDHGTREERAEAFYASFEGGMAACNAYFPDTPVA